MDAKQMTTERVDLVERVWAKVSAGLPLTAEEGAAALQAATGVAVALIEPCMEPIQRMFMDIEHAAVEAGDPVLADYAGEVWASIKLVPNEFVRLADIARQVDSRMKLVERVPVQPLEADEPDEA